MTRMRAAVIGFAAAALTACNFGNGPAPAPDTSGLTLWSTVVNDDIGVPEGVAYTQVAVEDVNVAQISGVPEAAPSTGSTGGVSIRLPPATEAQVSGQRVQVTVRAFSPESGALMGLAYSTNEVGNSGWQRFMLSTEPRDYVFAYNVPPSQGGNGDYLGFRSYGGGVVLVVGYKLEVVPDPSAPAQLR